MFDKLSGKLSELWSSDAYDPVGIITGDKIFVKILVFQICKFKKPCFDLFCNGAHIFVFLLAKFEMVFILYYNDSIFTG